VQPKHVAAIAFAAIKVVFRYTTSLLLRVLKAQRGYQALRELSDICEHVHVRGRFNK
jgi:hypothetical protein